MIDGQHSNARVTAGCQAGIGLGPSCAERRADVDFKNDEAHKQELQQTFHDLGPSRSRPLAERLSGNKITPCIELRTSRAAALPRRPRGSQAPSKACRLLPWTSFLAAVPLQAGKRISA